jgi:hypothetical protein
MRIKKIHSLNTFTWFTLYILSTNPAATPKTNPRPWQIRPIRLIRPIRPTPGENPFPEVSYMPQDIPPPSSRFFLRSAL